MTMHCYENSVISNSYFQLNRCRKNLEAAIEHGHMASICHYESEFHQAVNSMADDAKNPATIIIQELGKGLELYQRLITML